MLGTSKSTFYTNEFIWKNVCNTIWYEHSMQLRINQEKHSHSHYKRVYVKWRIQWSEVWLYLHTQIIVIQSPHHRWQRDNVYILHRCWQWHMNAIQKKNFLSIPFILLNRTHREFDFSCFFIAFFSISAKVRASIAKKALSILYIFMFCYFLRFAFFSFFFLFFFLKMHYSCATHLNKKKICRIANAYIHEHGNWW